ncbi:hypothetical protein L1887_58895 [Cichorium endivia]|nr:hypothetical protein L1887_58895 [Cichorium endivia]
MVVTTRPHGFTAAHMAELAPCLRGRAHSVDATRCTALAAPASRSTIQSQTQCKARGPPHSRALPGRFRHCTGVSQDNGRWAIVRTSAAASLSPAWVLTAVRTSPERVATNHTDARSMSRGVLSHVSAFAASPPSPLSVSRPFKSCAFTVAVQA